MILQEAGEPDPGETILFGMNCQIGPKSILKRSRITLLNVMITGRIPKEGRAAAKFKKITWPPLLLDI